MDIDRLNYTVLEQNSQYHYKIFDKNNKIIFEDKSLKEPVIKKLNSNLIEIMIGAGTNVRRFRYVSDTNTSGEFWQSRYIGDNLIWYLKDRNTVVVQDIFSTDKYYKETKIYLYDKIANPEDAILDFKKTGNNLVITHFIENYEEKTIHIKLD